MLGASSKFVGRNKIILFLLLIIFLTLFAAAIPVAAEGESKVVDVYPQSTHTFALTSYSTLNH